MLWFYLGVSILKIIPVCAPGLTLSSASKSTNFLVKEMLYQPKLSIRKLRNFLVNKMLHCKYLFCFNLALFLLWIYWQPEGRGTLSFWAVSQYFWSSFFTENVTATIIYKITFDTLIEVEQCFSSISLQNIFDVDTELSKCSSFKVRNLSLVPALLSFHI